MEDEAVSEAETEAVAEEPEVDEVVSVDLTYLRRILMYRH